MSFQVSRREAKIFVSIDIERLFPDLPFNECNIFATIPENLKITLEIHYIIFGELI